MHDIVIKNGTVIDGSGDPMYKADLAVNDGVITEMGDLGGEKARKVIDATDRYVSPGFIDISNRSDVYWRLFQDPVMESLLRQGITTIIGGNSGASLAPLYNKDMFLSTQKWTDVSGTNMDWETVEDFLSTVRARNLSVNFGTLVGHGTLRRGIVGDDARELSIAESTSLLKQVDDGMSEGALGVSLGLVYTHERSATQEELVHVAMKVKAKNGLLAVHLRDEDKDLIAAIDEIMEIAAQTHVRMHITHLKAVSQAYWPLMKEAIDRIDDMITQGYDISFDVYPYTVTGSVLYTFLPDWVTEGGKKMLLGRLRNDAAYNQVLKEMRASKVRLDNATVSIAPHAQSLRGRTLRDIAREREIDVERLILDLLIASDGRVVILFDALSEENIMRGLRSPYSIVTSNSPGYSLSAEIPDINIHPRSFGAFARLFDRYVKTRKVLSWELAVHKSTFKAAQRCGIADRGLLREGFLADIIVMDPHTIKDVATFERPLQYATGVEHIVINGIVTMCDGELVDSSAGDIVRRTR